MQSLCDINPRGELTTRDFTTMTTHSTGTPMPNSERAITQHWGAKKGRTTTKAMYTRE